jgi:hypothetical protein
VPQALRARRLNRFCGWLARRASHPHGCYRCAATPPGGAAATAGFDPHAEDEISAEVVHR